MIPKVPVILTAIYRPTRSSQIYNDPNSLKPFRTLELHL